MRKMKSFKSFSSPEVEKADKEHDEKNQERFSSVIVNPDKPSEQQDRGHTETEDEYVKRKKKNFSGLLKP